MTYFLMQEYFHFPILYQAIPEKYHSFVSDGIVTVLHNHTDVATKS